MAALAQDESDDGRDYEVLLFYKYCAFADRAAFRDAQQALCASLGLAGRLRVAEDGLNGVLGGRRAALEAYVAETTSTAPRHLGGGDTFDDVDWKWGAAHDARPIAEQRLRGLSVKLAREVVSLSFCGGGDAEGVRAAAPARHADPAEFHALLEAGGGDVVLLDVRNVYERRVGEFRADGVRRTSVDLRQFSDLPRALRDVEGETLMGATVLMYCTGGVRCERASALLRHTAEVEDWGVKDVVQLSGGIHRYLETYGGDGYFRGKNFVFDERMVDPNSAEVVGTCRGCAAPHDDYTTAHARCAKCRMRCLLCESCAAGGNAVALLCELCVR